MTLATAPTLRCDGRPVACRSVPAPDRARRPARASRSPARRRGRRPGPVPGRRRRGRDRQVALPRRHRAARRRARLPCRRGMVAPQDHDVPAASILDMARTMLRSGLRGARAASSSTCATRPSRPSTSASTAARDGHRRADPGRVAGHDDALFEDLQWADDLSLEIIGELARRSAIDRSCSSAATDRRGPARDEPPRLAIPAADPADRRRGPAGPLTAAETALVTTLILDTGLPAPREVVDAVYERTDGIPLHIEELLGALSAEARANGHAIREARCRTRSRTRCWRGCATGRPMRRRSPAPGAVIGRCFCPSAGRHHGCAARGARRRRSRSSWTTSSSIRPGPVACTTSGTSSCATRSIAACRSRDRRRYHARAGEFGARLEGQSEIHASLPLRARRTPTPGVRGGPGRCARGARAVGPPGSVRAVPPGRRQHARTTSEPRSAPRSSRPTARRPKPSRRTRSPSALARAAADAYRAAGKPAMAILGHVRRLLRVAARRVDR